MLLFAHRLVQALVTPLLFSVVDARENRTRALFLATMKSNPARTTVVRALAADFTTEHDLASRPWTSLEQAKLNVARQGLNSFNHFLGKTSALTRLAVFFGYGDPPLLVLSPKAAQHLFHLTHLEVSGNANTFFRAMLALDEGEGPVGLRSFTVQVLSSVNVRAGDLAIRSFLKRYGSNLRHLSLGQRTEADIASTCPTLTSIGASVHGRIPLTGHATLGSVVLDDDKRMLPSRVIFNMTRLRTALAPSLYPRFSNFVFARHSFKELVPLGLTPELRSEWDTFLKAANTKFVDRDGQSWAEYMATASIEVGDAVGADKAL